VEQKIIKCGNAKFMFPEKFSWRFFIRNIFKKVNDNQQWNEKSGVPFP